MFPQFLPLCFFGASLIWTSEAVLNLLDGVQYPLIAWDSQDLSKILAKESKIWQTCRKNNPGENPIANLNGSITGCRQKMYGIRQNSEPDHKELLSGNCERLQVFSECMREAWRKVKDRCNLVEGDKEFIENIELISNKMHTLLCEDKAKRIVDFIKQSGDCKTKKHEELLQCETNHSRVEMEFDTDDCRRAWSFVDCVEDTLEDCKEGASRIPVEVMTKGLMVTACKDMRVSGSPSLVPATILTLTASYFAINFA